MHVLKVFVFVFMLHLVYTVHTDTVNKDHYGNAVTRAYEKGNMKKLESLKCKVYGPKDKNIDRGFIYEMKDGKKVVC
jgi:hypothetical protein